MTRPQGGIAAILRAVPGACLSLSIGRCVRRSLGAALLLLGCSGSSEQNVQLEIVSWWSSPSEHAALEEVEHAFEHAHPDATVSLTQYGDKRQATDDVIRRMLQSDPPATFLVNTGADVFRWAPERVVSREREHPGMQSRCLTRDLGPLFQELGLNRVLPKAVLNSVCPPGSASCEDGPRFAVPVNIHRLNTVYWNREKWEEFNARYPDGLTAELLCAQAAGEVDGLQLKLAIGINSDNFTLLLLALENLLPALLGTEFYNEFFHGKAIDDEARAGLTRVFECTRNLVANANDRAATWVKIVELVANGEADLTIMGDWASGELIGSLSGDSTGPPRVVAMPFPSDKPLFVFTSDTFPFPVRARNPQEVRALLTTIASPQVQYNFSLKKGGIPARTDVGFGSEPHPCAVTADDWQPNAPTDDPFRRLIERTQRDFCDAKVEKVLATSGLLPYYYPMETVRDAFSEMVRPNAGPRAVDDLIDTLDDFQALVRDWNATLAAPEAICPP